MVLKKKCCSSLGKLAASVGVWCSRLGPTSTKKKAQHLCCCP
uniref:Uncharacterized protein n=1 Tax=Arundo donax TaxID=35708 RepID=A0A0A9FK53_ARUDO